MQYTNDDAPADVPREADPFYGVEHSGSPTSMHEEHLRESIVPNGGIFAIHTN
jgi:hypothetical protein